MEDITSETISKAENEPNKWDGQWKVYTYKFVYDEDIKVIDGSTTRITETVAPDHKLLSQTCSSSWVEGKRGPRQCLVSSILMHGTTTIKQLDQEYAVPEWELLKQSELAAQNEGQDVKYRDPDPWAPLFAMVKPPSPAQNEKRLDIECREKEPIAKLEVESRKAEPVAQLDVEPHDVEPFANLHAESYKAESVAQLVDIEFQNPEPIVKLDAEPSFEEWTANASKRQAEYRIQIKKWTEDHNMMPDTESRFHGLEGIFGNRPEKSKNTESRNTEPVATLASSYRTSMLKILACLFLLLVAFVVLMKQLPEDKELEHELERHHEMVQLLDATKSTGGISEVVRHKAYSAHSIAIRIGDSHLPGKGELSEHIGATADDLHTVSGKLETFRGNVRKMTWKLLFGHERTLREAEQRAQGSIFAWNRYKDGQKPPTKEQLRKQWNEFANSLTDTLSELSVKSQEIDSELRSIEESLQLIDGEMGITQEKTEMNYATARDSGWLYRLNIFALPASEYEKGIKLIDAFRPEIQTARKQVTGIGKSVGKVKAQLDLVMKKSSGKEDTNLVSWFRSREVITSVEGLARILDEDKI
ncbi:hypothetical protein PG999_012267 [Apiospora kogelbergensis]|uniref:Uncharacterized protein n=1 Tax=Apiospora kogelbergensis TaxID=1337665 RepID=A0AAW0QU33_9PEZI